MAQQQPRAAKLKGPSSIEVEELNYLNDVHNAKPYYRMGVGAELERYSHESLWKFSKPSATQIMF